MTDCEALASLRAGLAAPLPPGAPAHRLHAREAQLKATSRDSPHSAILIPITSSFASKDCQAILSVMKEPVSGLFTAHW